MLYYSQDGQDEFLNTKIFKGKRKGIFIDIGAYDGITFSNTYFLEKNLDWKGICIEPLPSIYKRLSESRTCTCVNACISDFNGVADFMCVEGIEVLSGLVDGYEKDHLTRVNREVEEKSAIKKIIKVKCLDFNTLVSSHDIAKIDYLSIDVEGNELRILKSIDFKCFNIRMLSVENNGHSNVINQFMFSKGFKFIKKVGADEFYARHNFFDKCQIIWSGLRRRTSRLFR